MIDLSVFFQAIILSHPGGFPRSHGDLNDLNRLSPGEAIFWFCVPVVTFFFLYLRFRYPPSRDYYYNRIKYKTPISRNEFITINNTLSQRFPYYSCLSADGKAKFVNRLRYFLSTKKFIGKEGLVINDEIKMMISAAGVQLTFGLHNYAISYFHSIFVYPSVFYSKLLRRDLKGAAFGGGVLCLSWRDFTKGYEVPDDRINLGLHEMAHALKIDVLRGDDFDSRFAFNLDEWLEAGDKELSKMQGGEKSFLRAYGGKNEHEFFAVCVENFFESPGNFKQKLPEVFEHLCVLLNQNPLNRAKDYAL